MPKKPTILLLFFVFLIVGFFVFVEEAKASSDPLPAINYAPNFWFDVEEKYYPANPLDFYFANGIEINGEIAVDKYNQLSLEEKIANLTVFYHIYDHGHQWVYQYWFFYIFNGSLGKIKNKHYGDWEAVFVFVDKDSKEINKVIGTAHQRRFFDIEIYQPENEHIWTYVGNGSHANCLDEEDDGYCDLFKWRFLEKWDKNGYKVLHNNYNLKELNFDFINEFKEGVTLEKSPNLSLFGGSPPTYAWQQTSYENPEKIRPFSWQYFKDKINNLKDKIINFFRNLIAKILALFKKPIQFQADISSLIEIEDEPLGEIKTESYLPEMPEILLPVKESEPEPIEPVELVEPIKEETFQPISQPAEPPIFIGSGGGGSSPAEPEPLSTGASSGAEAGEPEATTTTTSLLPPKIISPQSGDILGQQDDFATSTPGFQANLIGTSTPGLSTLIFINSTSTSPDYSTTTDSQGDWSQIITLEEGAKTIKAKAKDADNNKSEEVSLNLIVDITPPSKITDLSADSGISQGAIDLSWTAPGADEYIIRYATSSEITTSTWPTTIDVDNEPMPALASTTENLTISGLGAGQTYFWAIKSKDKAANLSEISNCASSSPLTKAENLVISELAVQGLNGANDEFIELYNPIDQAIDLDNWSIQYRGSEANAFEKKNFITGSSTPAYGYFLIANSSYDGQTTADMSHNSFQLSSVGGTIFLVNNQTLLTSATSSSIVDKIAYGSGTYLFPEGTEFNLVPEAEQSLERKATPTSTAELLAIGGAHHWLGNSWDTNNNSQDFVLQTQPNPQNSFSLTGPKDSFPGLADTAWPMLQHDIQHSGQSPYTGSATGAPTSTPKWVASLDSINPTSPVIGLNGEIYIGANNGKFYKVEASGSAELFYDTQTGGAVRTPALASDGTVYLTDDYFIYALSPAGQLKWKYRITDAFSPTIGSEGIIYIGSDHYLYALNPNGELIWQSPMLSNGGFILSPVLAANGIIYTIGQIGSCSGCQIVYALDSQDGSIIWQTDPGDFATAPSLSDEGKIFIGGNSSLGSSGLFALNSSDGSRQWYVPIGDISGSVTAIGQEAIYVGTAGYSLFALDVADGSIKWGFNTYGKVNASPIIDAAGTIYIGSNSKNFYALNPDGTIKWQYQASEAIKPSAAIGQDGTVYLASYDGYLYAFGE